MDLKTKTIVGALLKRETDKAYLVEKNGASAWIPKSQVKAIETESETYDAKGKRVNTQIVYMEIASWMADKDNVKPLV